MIRGKRVGCKERGGNSRQVKVHTSIGMDAVEAMLAVVQPSPHTANPKTKSRPSSYGPSIISQHFFLVYNERHTFPERSWSTLSDQPVLPRFISKKFVGLSTYRYSALQGATWGRTTVGLGAFEREKHPCITTPDETVETYFLRTSPTSHQPPARPLDRNDLKHTTPVRTALVSPCFLHHNP